MSDENEVKNDMALPFEMPKREEKVVKVNYPDGTSCDVIFTKLTQPIPKEEFLKLPREEAMNYCIEVPIETKEYFVDDAKKVICQQKRNQYHLLLVGLSLVNSHGINQFKFLDLWVFQLEQYQMFVNLNLVIRYIGVIKDTLLQM